MRYIVAVSEDTQIEDGIILKKEDIKNMIKNKSIVIVKEKTEPLIEELEINEKFETIPSMNLDDLNSENFPIIISMIKNKLSQKRILKDMKDSFEELKNEIKIVLSNSQSEYLYGEITKLCNEWYEKSEEKNKVKTLQKRLFKTSTE